MASDWKDGRNRTLIYFLVYYPRDIYFIRSIDGSNILKKKTSAYFFKLFDEIEQFIIDNAANYELMGKIVKEKRKNYFRYLV